MRNAPDALRFGRNVNGSPPASWSGGFRTSRQFPQHAIDGLPTGRNGTDPGGLPADLVFLRHLTESG